MRRYVIHYGEIGIKGDNRGIFERRLMDNIRAMGRAVGLAPVLSREHGRLHVQLEDDAAALDLERRLGEIPGIKYFAEAVIAPLDVDAIREVAVALSRELDGPTFQVRTRRSNKRFPLESLALNRDVGAAIAVATGMGVDLTHPAHTIWIDVTPHHALLFTRKRPGVGGLPVGVSGRAVALLSGGLDSPVAAWKLIRRGCETVLVHFHNYTRDQDRVRAKLLDLAAVLARFQLRSRLYLVPFEQLQSALIAAVPAPARMVAYRRMMLGIADQIRRDEGATAIITGDSVGQVASQTLENLAAIHAAASCPILSPLIGEDKDDIVAMARRIGTYDISIRPYEDCCSFLVARHPDTRVRLDLLEEREARIPLAELSKAAYDAAEVFDVRVDGRAAAVAGRAKLP